MNGRLTNKERDPVRERCSDWYVRAKVRTPGLRPVVQTNGSLPFTSRLLPYLSEEAVRSKGDAARTQLLRRAALRYLYGTSVLEIRCVNRVLSGLLHGSLRTWLPESMRVEATQIYCDEGYHAVVAADLWQQSFDAEEPEMPVFLRRFLNLIQDAGLNTRQRTELRFLFVTITETVISQQLMSLGRDGSITPELRQFVLDHGRDEARHSYFFSTLFAAVYPHVSAETRKIWSTYLPRLLWIYLAPSSRTMCSDLLRLGLTEPEATLLVRRYTHPEYLRTGLDEAAKPAVRLFERVGLMPAEHWVKSLGMAELERLER